MPDPGSVLAAVSRYIAVFFSMKAADLADYVGAVAPHVVKVPQTRFEEACRRLASEINEEFPRRPPPAAFIRVCRDLESAQKKSLGPAKEVSCARCDRGTVYSWLERIGDGYWYEACDPCSNCNVAEARIHRVRFPKLPDGYRKLTMEEVFRGMESGRYVGPSQAAYVRKMVAASGRFDDTEERCEMA
jgi:hypothetical protein